MIYSLTVPQAVPGVEEIRILEWHGETGSRFLAGDLIVELETHKAVVEVRAGQDGFLRALQGEPGDWLEIDKTLALFSDAAEEPLPADAEGAAELLVTFDVT
jgi:pyruvate/2-oxoglutarate dehydrogenase complex dihydrolipoamide acyltransferase (E2) component